MAEYIVTVAQGVDWRNVHNDLIRDTSTDDSVDSNIVPDRACECTLERPNSNRNTHYELTDQEAEQLKNDPRIRSVTSADAKNIANKSLNFIQTGNFNRSVNPKVNSGQQDNWALTRHTSTTTNESNEIDSSNYQNDYNYVLDGTGVDVVIMDTGIQPDHPEFEDANGVSRVKQIDWYAVTGLPNPGIDMVQHYTDQNGHGTHVASSVAGKKFGWAKNADIYSMKIDISNGTAQISTSPDANGNSAFDLLRLWHENKGNNRPTVINMSWGWFIATNAFANPVELEGVYTVQSITYRGVTTNSGDRDILQRRGFTANFQGMPYRDDTEDAELDDLLLSGAHVVIGAGNSKYSIDVPSGPDYNNYINVGGYGPPIYYHRGSTPHSEKAINVGALSVIRIQTGGDTQEQKAYDTSNYGSTLSWGSNTGPGVDLYAAGQEIIGAVPNGKGTQYHYNSNFRQDKYEGTSMASPQVAGMVACLLQAHPTWTPAQVKNYMIASATDDMRDPHIGGFNPSINGDTVWQDWAGLCGGANRVAYFPLHGNKPYGFNSSS